MRRLKLNSWIYVEPSGYLRFKNLKVGVEWVLERWNLSRYWTISRISFNSLHTLKSSFYISIVKPTRCINVSNLFYWCNTLHVSDGLSVHHQDLKTVHTATGICQTDTAICLLEGRSSISYPLADSSICLTYACCCMYGI